MAVVHAAHLGIIERLRLLPDNWPVEFTAFYYRSDKYDFVTELASG